MALGVILTSYSTRLRLSSMFSLLCFLNIFLGLLAMSLASYVYYVIVPVLYTDKSEVTFVFVVIGIFGIQVSLNYVAGLSLGTRMIKKPLKKSSKKLLTLWIYVTLFILLNLVMVFDLSRKSGRHIEKSMRHSIQIGMQNYLKDARWKGIIDYLQYKMSCCGVESYRDWYESPWLTRYQVNENNDLSKKFFNSDTNGWYVIPWSCCSIDFPMQCLHDPLQQFHYTKIWVNDSSIPADSLNAKGCIVYLSDPINKSLMIFSFLVAAIFVVNFLLILVSRYMYTSYRNATLLNDPTGIAPAWIFGRGDCGYSRGPSIYAIMENVNPKKLEKMIEANKRFLEKIDNCSNCLGKFKPKGLTKKYLNFSPESYQDDENFQTAEGHTKLRSNVGDSTMYKSAQGDSTMYKSAQDNSTLYKSAQGDPTFYKSAQGDSTMYKSAQDNSTMYKSARDDSTFYKSAQGDSTMFKSARDNSTMYKSAQDDATFYKSALDDSTLYKSAQDGSSFYKSAQDDATMYKSARDDSAMYKSLPEQSSPGNNSRDSPGNNDYYSFRN